MISINSVCKVLGKKSVLKDISLNIPAGSIFALIGENGAGKTTLIKCMTGILKTASGSISFDGQEVFENNEAKQRIGYVADQSHYMSYYKVSELAKFYSMTYKKFSYERFKKLNEIFKIQENKRVRELSKGMKMRVALMLNLSIMPDYLILDEPTSGLDPIAKKEVYRLLLQEVEERQITIFISSHNLDDLEKISDHIAIIKDGAIQSVSSIEEIKDQVKTLQVSFKDSLPSDIGNWKDIISVRSIGRVHYIVTGQYSEELEKKLISKGALFVEHIDMSLEDIFIHSIEGGKKDAIFKESAAV